MERTCLPLCIDPGLKGAKPGNSVWEREAVPELVCIGSWGNKPDSSRQGAWMLPCLQVRGCQTSGGSTRLLLTVSLFHTDSQCDLGQITYPLGYRPPWLSEEGVDLLGDLTDLPALTVSHLHTTNSPSLAFQFPVIGYYDTGIKAIYTFSHYHLLVNELQKLLPSVQSRSAFYLSSLFPAPGGRELPHPVVSGSVINHVLS